MRKIKIAYLLALAPLLMGAGEYASKTDPLIANSLPICAENEFLSYAGANLVCKTVAGGSLNVPDCSGKLLTYTRLSEIGTYACVDKGTNSLSAVDITTINTTYKKLVDLGTILTTIEMGGARSPAAKFCGLSAGTKGAMVGNGVTGVAGAAFLCSQVASCGANARQCSVYDMHRSVADGTIKATDTIAESWVYMASWQHSNLAQQSTPTGGLSDNCGGDTYPTGDLKWYGTTVQWKNASTNFRALHFKSGPGVVSCASTLPIACCK